MQIRVVHVVLQVAVGAVAVILDFLAEAYALPRGLRTAARVTFLDKAFRAATQRVSERRSIPHQRAVGRDLLGSGWGGAGGRERRRGSLQDSEDGGRDGRRSEEHLLRVDLDAVDTGGRGGGGAAGAAVERVRLRAVC